MEEVIYLDGEFVAKGDAKISVFDHGLLYGDGVFEGIRLYEKNIFRFEQHLDRLWSSARSIMLDIPMSREEMIEATCETCRRNGLTNGYIRLVVTRGVGDLGLAPWICKKPSVFIIAAGIQLYPKELYENGLQIVTAATRRIAPDTFSARVKSLNYLNNIMAKINAQNAGAPEALLLNREGYVVEATADNVFLIKDGMITTPPTYIGALRGITRDAAIDIARHQGYTVREEPFALYEVYDADEMFLTGTAAEVISVVKVDGRTIGNGKPGPITNKLLQEFRAITATDGTKI
ncbi:branched-chain-amino-acid transaminase [bacterium]|nr:branched-chain-amino-acid transaminase [bacterium]